ncbi:hypothetical protein G7B40_013940 [Aetokthonos hydrillicola Thurmond2011]|jgi:hypothetical protein|uniref:Uncharacterized protein n=1 Tax=Aetokthonos hydrillicola Thurmond2011 TaxID=2712845 RepID=A0AAP5I6K2_9CYAN|nr:hypothetical protein [Aetokthonos hydrillicola]MBO3460971.1 hypothetical protein [Aetokthonos hydrillicola CCALA 1050]MBW4583645.1 hypothetical protein [Aetokthonos hydrillicola CCALA 1050]MDR9895660.1 hypothetical protein [Aetokthonos hydrillicola Thurmond2011]
MTQNTNKTGVLQRIGRILPELLEFLISPWLNRGEVKRLQDKVYSLERQIRSQSSLETEEHLTSMIQYLQEQIDNQQEHTITQLENLKKHDLPNQVEETLTQKLYIRQIIKSTVEELMHELAQKNTKSGEIKEKQEELQTDLEHIEKLTASFPKIKVQKITDLEAGKWLLASRVDLAQSVALELLSPQDPNMEVFCFNIRQYLKLLGHCLENGIEPSLLYQGVITHDQPPAEIYLKAFKLILSKYISNWESSNQISNQAADELRRYFKYLVDYLDSVLDV